MFWTTFITDIIHILAPFFIEWIETGKSGGEWDKREYREANEIFPDLHEMAIFRISPLHLKNLRHFWWGREILNMAISYMSRQILFASLYVLLSLPPYLSLSPSHPWFPSLPCFPSLPSLFCFPSLFLFPLSFVFPLSFCFPSLSCFPSFSPFRYQLHMLKMWFENCNTKVHCWNLWQNVNSVGLEN